MVLRLPRGGGRVRRFVGERPATQRIGVVVVLAVALTAPFGGLEHTRDTGIVPLKLRTRYDIGPFYVTVDKVVTLADLAPTVSPEPGNRLLVIEVTVKNHSYRAEDELKVAEAFGGTGTGVVPWKDYDEDTPLKVFDVVDGTAGQSANPGQSYQLALVAQQEPSWKPGHFVLQLSRYRYQADDPVGLDDNEWLLRDVMAQGPIDVEVKT